MKPPAFLLAQGRAFTLLQPYHISPIARLRPLMAAAQRSYVTAFGYIQSQALVYSENGQPKDVL